jgi:hypothetical protein
MHQAFFLTWSYMIMVVQHHINILFLLVLIESIDLEAELTNFLAELLVSRVFVHFNMILFLQIIILSDFILNLSHHLLVGEHFEFYFPALLPLIL